MKKKKSKISVGVIGCGNWGFNHVRVFGEHSKCILSWCCDLNKNILKKINERYTTTKTTNSYEEILEDVGVDAVCISTPAITHFEIAKKALDKKKHVLIEKPLATNSKSATELVKRAIKNKVLLMPGHVFNFNPCIKKIQEIIKSGQVGNIFYLNSTRTGFGPIRNDVNAMWDLAPHDIYTIANLIGEWPVTVTATGSSFIRKKIEDVVFLSMKFRKNKIANVHLSWLNPSKIRRMEIVGDKKMIEFDDVSINEKVKIYNKRVIKDTNINPSFLEFQLSLRDGDIYLPKISKEEPLKIECEYFLDSINKSKIDKKLCVEAIHTISVLEAAEKSMSNFSKDERIQYRKI